jgi:hypothetical protein
VITRHRKRLQWSRLITINREKVIATLDKTCSNTITRTSISSRTLCGRRWPAELKLGWHRKGFRGFLYSPDKAISRDSLGKRGGLNPTDRRLIKQPLKSSYTRPTSRWEILGAPVWQGMKLTILANPFDLQQRITPERQCARLEFGPLRPGAAEPQESSEAVAD